jgi:hypothetical protein
MDATRTRRTKDRARQTWYASSRQHRFARHMGFALPNPSRLQAAGPSLREPAARLR